jgi:uncharacterized protein
MIKALFAIALSLTLIGYSASAQDNQDSTKLRHIRELMDLMGSGHLGMQVMKSMLDQYKKSLPDVDPQFWDDCLKEINPNELVNLVVPIYAKYFTDEDILGIMAFYNSPVGKKLVEKLPSITQESMQAGVEWGQQIGEKVRQRLREKGYLKNS